MIDRDLACTAPDSAKGVHLYTPRLRQTLQQLDRTKCTTQVSAHLCEYLQATCYESCRSARVVVALTPRPELGGAVGATTNLRTAREVERL